jgi:hypothetical protein
MPAASSRVKLVILALVVACLVGGCTQDFHVFEDDAAPDGPNDGGHPN